MSFGGGGGGAKPAPAPAPKVQTIPLPDPRTAPRASSLNMGPPAPAPAAAPSYDYGGDSGTVVAPPPEVIRNFLYNTVGDSGPLRQAASTGGFLYGDSFKPKEEKPQEFLGGGKQQLTQPGMRVDRKRDVRAMASVDPGMTMVPSAEGLPPATYAVAAQAYPGQPPGGDGFGRRALIGSEGEVVTQALPADTVQQTDTPTAAPAGDVIPVGESPTPGAAVAPDANYVLLSEQGQGGMGFMPNSKLAQQVATGPFSRYLQNPRMARGFGARIFGL